MYMFTYFSKKLTFKNPYVILFQRGLYPTFKEWKRVQQHRGRIQGFRVYILPLRNENLCIIIQRCTVCIKSLYPTFKEWKLHFIHVNLEKFNVYILPLRNENPSVTQPMAYHSLGLYPTFKEWKRIHVALRMIQPF